MAYTEQKVGSFLNTISFKIICSLNAGKILLLMEVMFPKKLFEQLEMGTAILRVLYIGARFCNVSARARN